VTASLCNIALCQEYGKPDVGEPGDAMIQEYLARETAKLSDPFLGDVKTSGDWERERPRFKEEYLHMLGLSPMPPKTPLQATITGTLERDGYVVDKIHYQSLPRLYVTGNLYRPANAKPGERLPAIFYVCGHSGMGRDGNKAAYQSHGIWFAKHGYICLVVDTLQLGEIAAIHHGTYREGRWWWHSRGYTPAGVECLNGIRGIDYLVGRPDVDPERLAVTGISGGGAATYWIAAADERVKVAVPVSGMADLPSYVTNRVINGHCDCMFAYNTFRWPWACIAALIAPRPMLFANSDADSIFPMDANERVINRLKRVYSLYGASDAVNSVVSIGGHAYRKDIRQAAFGFLNMHLKGDPRVVTDSEADLVTGPGEGKVFPIAPKELRVFPEDSDLPKDELNTTIDQVFVPMAEVAVPAKGEFEAWKGKLLAELRRVTFTYFPDRIPAAKMVEQKGEKGWVLETEDPIRISLEDVTPAGSAPAPKRILLVIRTTDTQQANPDWLRGIRQDGDVVYRLDPRGVGPTRWTRKNPPNYVLRSHVLLGRTVDTGRVWDVAAAARFLRARHNGNLPVFVAGEGAAALIGAYAALFEPDIAGAILNAPPLDHMRLDAPVFLNILRVCNAPEMLGMLAPRPLTVHGAEGDAIKKVAEIYAAAGAPEKFKQEPR
jgi:dienelactone hydrolase